MTKKRDRLEIIYDILNIIREKGAKIKPTHILYKSNLSHQMLKLYMAELIEKNFVVENTDKKGSRSYEITEKGNKFLAEYSAIRGFIDSYGLD